MKVMLDTSALISLVDKSRDNHEPALHCVKVLSQLGHFLQVSVIAISEYGVRHDDTEKLKDTFKFEIVPFTRLHAHVAAAFKKHTMLEGHDLRDENNKRLVIQNDTMIIAQANAERIAYILTDDKNTFEKTARRLEEKGMATTRVVYLGDLPLEKMGIQKQGELPLY